MAKQNTLAIILIILLIAGAIIFIFKPDFSSFIITGGEKLSRDYPSIVNANSAVTISYVASSFSGKWGATVIDTLSCPGFTDQKKMFVMMSDLPNPLPQTYQIPNKEGLTCNLIGNYQFGNKSVQNFMSQTIQTRITTPICISRDELGLAIEGWKASTITRDILGSKIQEWSQC